MVENHAGADSMALLRHELRTPLNHVLGYAGMLLEDSDDSSLGDSAHGLREIQSGGRALLDAIQAVLGDSGSAVTT